MSKAVSDMNERCYYRNMLLLPKSILINHLSPVLVKVGSYMQSEGRARHHKCQKKVDEIDRICSNTA